MKNETRIKIIETRHKYFQELRNEKTEKKPLPENRKQPKQRPEKSPEPEPRSIPRPGIQLELEFEEYFRYLMERVQAIRIPKVLNNGEVRQATSWVGLHLHKAGSAVSGVHQRLSDRINRRTEKVIDRFYSYMMVIFDA